MRRFDFGDAESGQRPGAVLVAQQAQPERLLPRCAGDDHALPDRALGQPKLLRRIADAHIDGLFGWTLKTPLLQPDRQPGAASGGVDDDVGGHKIGFVGVAVEQHPGDPLGVEVEAWLGHRAMLNLDIGNVVNPAPDLPFQLRTAGHVGGELVAQRMPGAQHMPGRAEVDAVRPVLQDGHTGGHHVVEQTGEQPVEFQSRRGPSAGEHGGPAGRRCGCSGVLGRSSRSKTVTRSIEVGQHPRRAQPGDARADHDSVSLDVLPTHLATVLGTVRVHG